MARARKILRRRDSIRNIHAVTRTMEMVATARFQAARKQIDAIRPYTDRVMDLVSDLLARHDGPLEHPLMTENEDVQREVLFVLSSDRGLAGSYNEAVLRVGVDRLRQVRDAGYHVELHAVGKKGIGFLKFRGLPMEQTYTDLPSPPDYAEISRIAHRIMQRYLNHEISGVEVAYTRLLSGGRMRPVIAQILPLTELQPAEQESAGPVAPYEMHPTPDEILRNLMPATVRLRLYQCFLDAAVTEQMSRINAMRQATENADEMIQKLTLKYNRTRQTQITAELAEIMGGRASLEEGR